MAAETKTVLRPDAVLDVENDERLQGASVRVEGNRIVAVGDVDESDAEVIELPGTTLLPGLMDMEVDLVLGGPGAGLTDPVRSDPVTMTLRGAANARRTLLAGFTTVRNLGLFVKTGGYLLDVALANAIDAGWIDGPRVVPAGHAIVPTGGHLDPRAQSGLAPGIMPMSVEEGIADGVDEVRKAVRYQIRHGAQLIKCCASGGVMSATGPSGAQQYSAEEFAAIADEAHRRGLKVAAHAHGDTAVNAALDAGIDCIEHGFMISDATIQRLVDTGTFLVSTTSLADNWDISAQRTRSVNSLTIRSLRLLSQHLGEDGLDVVATEAFSILHDDRDELRHHPGIETELLKAFCQTGQLTEIIEAKLRSQRSGHSQQPAAATRFFGRGF